MANASFTSSVKSVCQMIIKVGSCSEAVGLYIIGENSLASFIVINCDEVS